VKPINPYQPPRVNEPANRPRRYGRPPWQVGPLLMLSVVCLLAFFPAFGLAASGEFGIIAILVTVSLAAVGAIALMRSYGLFRRDR